MQQPFATVYVYIK